jgi:hypothetical protein
LGLSSLSFYQLQFRLYAATPPQKASAQNLQRVIRFNPAAFELSFFNQQEIGLFHTTKIEIEITINFKDCLKAF